MQLDKFILKCMYCTNVEVIEVALCCFTQYQKNAFILQFVFILSVAS